MSRLSVFPTIRSQQEILVAGKGLISEGLPVLLCASSLTPVSQTVYALPQGLKQGQVVTNIVLNVITAGAGTVPTSIFVGLCDSTGARVAVSANLKSSVIWTATGYAVAPLTPAYTVPADGLYYAEFLQDTTAAWGTTALILNRPSSASASMGSNLVGAGAPTAWSQTGQATIPTQATITGNSTPPWMGTS